MKIVKKKIIGCYEILPQIHDDKRGLFVKTFHAPTFKKFGLQVSFKEQYYSTSSKNVIRGLHFQIPPKDHAKLIYCILGEVVDIVLDMRVGSPSYKKYVSIKLSAQKGNMIFIPKGLAHVFCTISKKSTLVYNTTTVYDKKRDSGIRWGSAGIKWPIKNPIISERDLNLQVLKNFINPFVFDKNLV